MYVSSSSFCGGSSHVDGDDVGGRAPPVSE